MTILEFKRHFKKELSGIYNEAESAEIYSKIIYMKVGFSKILQRKFAHQELLKSDEEDLLKILEELKKGKLLIEILHGLEI